MVCVRIILLFVVLFACLASPALTQLRSQSSKQQQPDRYLVAIAAIGRYRYCGRYRGYLVLWVDESKIYIVFCILADCKNAGHPWQDCYCCGNVYRKESCHPTLAECKAHCPLCNPSCSPSPPTVRSTMDGPALAATDAT
uniref:Embryo surrounding factor 1 brassicaceae domain-containing protein n=1 Tax=Setaria viridis TaxID=4556 RepID=A0A4V6Y7R9_SETVI|nr:hypothetical protein SEVIR_9G313100v2 [Setaria viridis]